MRSETRADSRLFGELVRSLMKEGIAVRFRANGRSMYPAIADGEVVQVEASSDSATRGEVVMVESAGGVRLHRVVQAGNNPRTQGDCCFEDDGETSAVGAAQVVRDGSSMPVPAQRVGSRLRRWLARWRGRF